MSPVARILRRAAEMIRKGWHKREYRHVNCDGVVDAWCAAGALTDATEELKLWGSNSTAYDYLKRAIDPQDNRYDTIVQWNDFQAKDAEEVAHAMEIAAGNAERDHATPP